MASIHCDYDAARQTRDDDVSKTPEVSTINPAPSELRLHSKPIDPHVIPMAENFDLEELVHLEQTFYDTGYSDGFAHGRIHGLIEGRALGREKGFEIWEEIGFYEGFARTWQAIYAQRHQRDHDQRAVQHIAHLLDLIRQFPTANPSTGESEPSSTSVSSKDEIDLMKLQSQIRSRYKALCASLGIRPTFRAGAPRNDAREGRVATNGTSNLEDSTTRRDVWTLEGDVRRATLQGLSF